MNLNKVFLLGRLTADPILKTTPTGQQVATFSIATNRVWTDKTQGKKEDTQFHNIVVWGRQAEIAQRFLTKGGMVLVEGRLQTRTWDDKQGGKRRTTEIVAESIQLGPRPHGAFGGPRSEGMSAAATPAEVPSINLDESAPAQDFVPEGDINPEDLNF
jgi:single-strand DNA-binding protein